MTILDTIIRFTAEANRQLDEIDKQLPKQIHVTHIKSVDVLDHMVSEYQPNTRHYFVRRNIPVKPF